MGGIELSAAEVTDRGLKYDRRWMLVNEKNQFLTIRELPEMTLLHPSIEEGGIRIKTQKHPGEQIFVPFESQQDSRETVTIWNATCPAQKVGSRINEWFSGILGISCKLVFMPESTHRPVDTTSGFKPKGKLTSFADAYPFLLLGEASVADLNQRYQGPGDFSIDRFRPNLVFSGGLPNQEDEIEHFTINDISFLGLEKCARCGIPNVDPSNGKVHERREPLATLAKYRLEGKKINFGRNVVHSGTGVVHVGDEIKLVN